MCMHRGQPPLLTAARRGSSKKKQSASSHPARLHTEVKRTQGACSTFPHCNFNDATSWSNSTPRTTGKTISSSVIASEKPLSVKNRLDEVKFRCFPVKRTLRRQECSPRRSGGERTVYLSCSTKRFPPSCCFASRRQRSNETDAGRPVQRKLLAAGPANHTGGSRNRHGGDWLPGRPQGEGFRNPESGFCDRCGDVLRV